MSITIYHNPRCSKSRQTLALLEERTNNITIIKYLETPPSKEQLSLLITQLGVSPRELLRKGEDDFKQLKLNDASLSDDMLIDAMIAHPKLIERPIVVKGNKAIIGRPPENVITLF